MHMIKETAMPTLTIDGYQMPYTVAGSGPPLVLLHDGFLHSPAWDRQVEPFAQHYQVIRYDRRGYGSSLLPTQPYSLLADLAGLLDTLQLAQVTLIGASMGGGLAVEFALHHPQRVRQLVLVGAALLGLQLTDHFYQRIAQAMRPLNEQGDLAGTLDRWLGAPYLFAPDSHAAREHFRRTLEQYPQNLTNTFHLVQLPDDLAVTRLTRLTVPTLILAGIHDAPDVHATTGAL
jgi:pimeloyl-ACP methyl ester carboxylesterase